MESNTTLKLNLISVNVRGVNSNSKRKVVIHWLKKLNADIIFLQETFSTSSSERSWKQSWNGKIIHSHGTNHSKGVAILFKDNLDVEILSCKVDDDGRYVCMNVKIQDQLVYLMNMYAPCSSKSNDQLTFYTNMLDVINTNRRPGSMIVIGGDLNILMNINLDRYGGNPTYNTKVMEKVTEIMECHDLIDIWRVRNPHLRQYTWRQNKPLIQSRLDYWLISDTLQDLVNKVDIKPAIKTDHSAIFLSLDQTDSKPHGPSYWKFNDSLCKDPDYCKMLADNVPKWIDKYSEFDDHRISWEIIKFEIRRATQSFSKKKAMERDKSGQVLHNKVNEAESYLCENPSEDAKNAWLKAKDDLEQHYNYITLGLITRSRATWYEQGEKSNKFFLNLEKSHKCKSTIRKVLTDSNVEITNSHDVLNEIKNFYTTLYQKQNVDLSLNGTRDFLYNDKVPRLSEIDKHICEGDLTINECNDALNGMTDGKSPGNDGFTTLFYKTFWNIVGNLLVNSLNSSLVHGELTHSQKQGVITLILKKDKDKRKISSYRPITLLNVDLKICSKAIANRLSNVMPALIGKEQTAFVKGRYIGDAVRTVADVLYYTKDKHIPGVLMCIDFEKAYDSVDHDFLHAIIKTLNFGESFQKWIKIMYCNVESCVMNNGTSTGYFTIKRGLRQGDPLSCQLFNLVIQMLCTHILNRDDIKGIPIGTDKEVKLSVYADDMCMFLKNECSVDNAMDALNKFKLCSGMKVNVNKTEAMWIGSARNRNDSHGIHVDIVWSKVVKILGIHFTYDDNEMIKLNYENKLNALKCLLGMWKQRNLSTLGKITVVKTFAISKFIYTSAVLSMPNDIINKINDIIYKFIWNGPDRLKRKSVRNKYDNGGLKMIDLKSRVRTQNVIWLKRLIMPNESAWKDILHYYLEPFGGIMCLNNNFDVKKVYGLIPPFYQEALKIWAELSSTNPSTVDEILSQTVWNNRFILVGKKSVYYSKFAEAGFHTLYDFIDGNGMWLNCPKDKLYKDVDYIKWIGIIHAIPHEWKLKILNSVCNKENRGKNLCVGLKLANGFVTLDKLSSASLYNHLNSIELCQPICEFTLITSYGISLSNCKHVYMIPFTSTICSQSRWFQYRVTHGILPTNSWLYRIGKITSPKCSFCSNDNETIHHLFVDCSVTSTYLSTVESNINILPSLNSFMKIYGVISDNNVNHIKLVNQILIIARRCVYRCRSTGFKPTYTMFHNMLIDCMKTELIIAEGNNKSGVHYNKWDPVLTGQV